MSEFTGEHDYRDVLIKAASLVEEGWCQGFLWRDGSDRGELSLPDDKRPEKVCLQGAIELAAEDIGIASQAALERMSIYLCGAPYIWNDDPSRTADEVADALRRAAE